MKQYYVYILTNKTNKVIYIGVTNNLIHRMYEHKNKLVDGFTKKYNLEKLVYFETTTDVNSALIREKQLKNRHRAWKNNIINEQNPNWKDLSEEWMIRIKYIDVSILNHKAFHKQRDPETSLG